MNGLPAPRVLPWGPVGAIIAQRNRQPGPVGANGQPMFVYDPVWVGRTVGCRGNDDSARRRYHRLVEHGLTLWEADRIAVALGWLPWTIWGEAYWAVPGAADEDRADGAFRVLRVAGEAA